MSVYLYVLVHVRQVRVLGENVRREIVVAVLAMEKEEVAERLGSGLGLGLGLGLG